jgi:ATP-dependent DNA ligase
MSAGPFIPPCIPTRVPKPPAGRDWVHEIKHDGYRLQVRREGAVVRLFTRRGYDFQQSRLSCGFLNCVPPFGRA